MSVQLIEGLKSAGEHYQYQAWRIQRGDLLHDTETGEMCQIVEIFTDRVLVGYADGILIGDTETVLLRQLWDEYQVVEATGVRGLS